MKKIVLSLFIAFFITLGCQRFFGKLSSFTEKFSEKLYFMRLFLVVICLLSTVVLFSQKSSSLKQNSNFSSCATDLYINSIGERGGCPLITSCHDPAIRDGYLWDESQPVKIIKTIVQVIRETNGSNPAATVRDVTMQFHHLNLDYAPYGIQFTYFIQYIDDSSIRNVNTPQEIVDIMTNHVSQPNNYLNIFVGGGPASLGFYPWLTLGYTGVFINELPQFYPANNRSTISHEIGHSLGLYHSFTGYDELPCGDMCAENMGSLGDTVGDFCIDTPPQQSNFNPYFTPTIDNCTGIPFMEIPHINYLSYSDNKLEFTPQQAARMHCYLSTSSNRTGWLDDTSPEIPYVYIDNFGYVFVEDVFSVNEWIDITSSGTEITGLMDDNVVGPIDVGFDIPFYGDVFNNIYIGSNGYISFNPIQINTISGLLPSIPTNDGKDGFFAPFLADLNFTGAGNSSRVFLFSNQSDQLVINFENVSFYNQSTGYLGSNTFQIIIDNISNELKVTYQYLDMDDYYPPSYWQTANPSIIGIENSNGTKGLEVNNYRIPNDLSRITISLDILSVIQVEKGLNIQVFPNPVSEILYIESNLHTIKSYTIYSIAGQKISSGGNTNNYIDLTQIKEGLYFIELTTSEGKKWIEKIIVN